MKPPSRHRILAFVLLALQAAVVALMSEHSRFVLIVLAAAFVLLPGWFQRDLNARTKQIVALVLAVAFVIKSQVTPDGDFPMVRALLPYPHGYAICQFCLTLQLILLFVDAQEGRPHGFPLLLGVVTFLYAGNKYSEPAEALAYRLLAILFVIVAAFFLAGIWQPRRPRLSRADSRLRTKLLAYAAVAVCLLAVVGGNLIKAAEPKFLHLIGKIHFRGHYETATPGFSSRSELGNVVEWKIAGQEELALRVISPQIPGYLRGRVYERFDGRNWTPWSGEEEKRREQPFRQRVEGLPRLEPDEYLFDVREKGPQSSPTDFGSGEWWALDVRPAQPFSNVFFTRLGASLLGASIGNLNVSPAGAADSHENPLGGKYRLFVPEKQEAPVLGDRDRYLQIPDRLDPRVREIAQEIFRSRETVVEKAQAVESYFRTRYRYQLTPQFPSGPFRIGRFNYFMIEKPPAHCEFFASGAVVLLRLAGVPCRYVTGFVVEEENFFGDYWIARNRDAHAWAEAYDEEQGWMIVEATPPAGLPGFYSDQAAGAMAHFWDAVKFSLSRTRSDIQSGGLRRFFLDFFETILWKTFYFRTLPGLLVAFCFLAAAILYLVRNWRHRQPAETDPLVAALHRALAEVDRKLARRAMRRAPTETLHQFANRISAIGPDNNFRKVADWYREYAALRYGGRLGPENVQALRGAMPA